MPAALTADDLITAVKDQACIPATEGRFGTATLDLEKGILRCADRVMRTWCSDLLTSTRAMHWGKAYANVSIASGTHLYAVPPRALAAGVLDVLITDGTYEWSAPEIPQADAWRFRAGHGGWDSPYAYTWRENLVELLPNPTESTYSLRFMFARQPSLLVPASFCAGVTAVTSTTITGATTNPVLVGGWASPMIIDVVSAATNGLTIEDDIPITFSGSTITRTSGTFATSGPYAITIPSAPSGVFGAYACSSGKTCVPAVPETVWPVLVDGTTLEVLRAFGDMAGVSDARERLAESVTRAKNILNPRSRGASQKIVARGYGTRRGWR